MKTSLQFAHSLRIWTSIYRH